MRNRSLPALLAIALAVAVPAWAKDDKTPPGQDKPLNQGMEKRLEQGKELPKGWKKKLQKGSTLEASVYAQGKKVSRKDNPKLPETKAGEELVQIKDTIVRIKAANREILEVIAPEKTAKKDRD